MNFKLRTFARNEIRQYKVIRQGEYSIDNPKGTEESFIFPMLIYKKTLKLVTAGADGLRETHQLNGKIEKKFNLKTQDIIEFENKRYRVIEIMPRAYADFVEFTLGAINE